MRNNGTKILNEIGARLKYHWFNDKTIQNAYIYLNQNFLIYSPFSTVCDKLCDTIANIFSQFTNWMNHNKNNTTFFVDKAIVKVVDKALPLW